MTDHTVVRFPTPRTGSAAYTDTEAVNDIHAILCRRGGLDPGMLEDVALVLARSGRLVVEVRDIEAAVAESAAGLPEARVDAGGTKLVIHQGESGGLVVAIEATAADEAQLIVTLNKQQLHPLPPRRPAHNRPR